MAESEPEQPVDDGDVTKAWKAAKLGNSTAMISLLQAWLPFPARRTARKLDSNINDTDVVQQEASLRVYQESKSKQWESKDHFKNWIVRIIRNIGIDLHRHEHGRRVSPATDASTVHEGSPGAANRPKIESLSEFDCLIAKIPDFSTVDRISLEQVLKLLKEQAPNSFRVLEFRYFNQDDVVSIEATAKGLGYGIKKVRDLERNAFRFLTKHLRNESQQHDTR